MLTNQLWLTAMAPFYSSLCAELSQPLNSDLLEKMKADNAKELDRLQEAIENAEKNFGETEQRDALLAKAEYLSKIGDKVSSGVCGSPKAIVYFTFVLRKMP